eukprot:g58696.t1
MHTKTLKLVAAGSAVALFFLLRQQRKKDNKNNDNKKTNKSNNDSSLEAKEPYVQKTEFEGVTALAKANLYFDNKVISHTLMFPDGKKKTIGIILPGEFYFGTEKAELMEITSGEAKVKVDGSLETRTYGAGTKFRVEANSGFSIAVKGPAPAQYVCSFLDN